MIKNLYSFFKNVVVLLAYLIAWFLIAWFLCFLALFGFVYYTLIFGKEDIISCFGFVSTNLWFLLGAFCLDIVVLIITLMVIEEEKIV